MGNLIELIRSYRATTDPDEKIRLVGEVICLVGGEIYLFLLPRVSGAADDVRQQVFIAIARGMDGFRGDSEREFWGWCYQIARNTVSKHFRDGDPGRFVPLDPDEIARLLDASAQGYPYETDEKSKLDEALALLKKSKPKCFDLIWGHYIVGLGYKEIAAADGLNYDTVRMRVERCLDDVRALLE